MTGDRVVPRYFGDDPEFLRLVEGFSRKLALDLKPDDLFVIRVDNWFDRKWFVFSGNRPYEFMAVGDDGSIIARQPIRRAKRSTATFPPFVPNRIVRETHLKAADGWVSRTAEPDRIHPLEKRPSVENLDRTILAAYENAVFLWFSSRTQANGRGTLMLYNPWTRDLPGAPRAEGFWGFWASFERRDGWSVDRTVAVNRDDLVRWTDPILGRGAET